MLGRKTTTPPTPPITPSTSRERRGDSTPAGHCPAIQPPRASNPPSIQPIGHSPTVKVTQKMPYITAAKIGSPNRRWTSTLSTASERARASARGAARSTSWTSPLTKPK